MSTAREAALAVLQKWRTNGAWSEPALNAAIQRAGLDRRDSALCTRICYGTLQNLALLDAYVDAYSKTPAKKLEPKVLDILRISIYQLRFLQQIPAHAAVNEAVALCKKSGCGRASGLVNAVLRRVSENEDQLPPLPEEAADRLSILYSHPKWLVVLLLKEHDADFVEAFLKANNDIPAVCLQTNMLKISTEALQNKLREAGFTCDLHPNLPDALLCQGGDLAGTEAFRSGEFYIQDAAARMAVRASDVKPGMRVLDACAAPGGKSFAAAIQMQNTGRILSCDLHENKLKRIREGAERLGISILETKALDARQQQGSYDVVLADVPCSGLGIIRKKPEIRYKDPGPLENLPKLQGEIIENLSDCVRPGGVLLYSTCTILRRENEGVVEAFLNARPDYSVEEMRTLWPQSNGTDGFFICKLRRSK